MLEKVRKATEIVKLKHPNFKIEGPIQYDAAVDMSVAKTKLPNSEVAGQASVLIFPDLNTGNNSDIIRIKKWWLSFSAAGNLS